jgi:phosphoglycolate phosphatase-like HAD superfamily hydrolase
VGFLVKTILFDVDGVLLSEEHYFDASALTVWEMLISQNYLALAPDKFKTEYSDSEIKEIREQVFGPNDEVLKLMKSRGLNANWDMIYLSFSQQLIHLLSQIKNSEFEKITQWCQAPMNRETLVEIGTVLRQYEVNLDFTLFVRDFERSNAVKQELLEYLNVLAKEKLGVDTSVFKKGELWSVCEHVSQEWYVGDDNVLESTGRPSVQLGKKGFLANETTLASKEEISNLFQFLKTSGYQIGIGTGRPELETVEPFYHLDWLKYFDEKRIVTADEVLNAEKELPEAKSLSKPHPFTYIAAIRGKDSSVRECLETPLPLNNGNEVLIVGDSLADLLAARQMGAQFAAVLTGLSGKAARNDFEKHEADYILDSVLDLRGIL